MSQSTKLSYKLLEQIGQCVPLENSTAERIQVYQGHGTLLHLDSLHFGLFPELGQNLGPIAN